MHCQPLNIKDAKQLNVNARKIRARAYCITSLH